MFRRNKQDKINTAAYLKCTTGYYIMKDWLRVKQQGRSLVNFFNDNNFTQIAIYGMAELGELMYEELKSENINIICGIDKRKKGQKYKDLEICDIKDTDFYKQAEVIVVTPVQYFDEIGYELRNKCVANIISIEDIIYYCS